MDTVSKARPTNAARPRCMIETCNTSRDRGLASPWGGRDGLVPAILAFVVITALQPLTARAALSDGLWGYWPFDDSFADASGNGRNLTPGAAPTIDSANQKAGSGTALFSGKSGGHLTCSGFPTGSTSVTYAAWFNRDQNGPGLGYGVIGAGSTSPNGSHFMVRAGPADETVRVGADLSAGSDNWHSSVTTFPSLTWKYLVVTYDKDTKQVRLYIDGTLDSGFPVTLTDPLNLGTGSLRVGGDAYNDNYMDGRIDEVGVWTRSLSAQEVTNLFNANGRVITAGVTNDLWAYWAMDGDFTDSSGNSRDLSAAAPVSINTVDQQAGAGAADLNSDSLGVAGFPTGSTSMTYAAWFNRDQNAGGLGYGVIGAGATSPNASHFMMRAGPADETVRIGADLSAGSDNWHSSVATFPSLTWKYLVVTYDKDTKQVNLYINGTRDAGFPVTLTDPLNLGTGALRVGGDAYGDNDLLGLIDEAAVWTRALSSNEVAALYLANGLMTGGPPTADAGTNQVMLDADGSGAEAVTLDGSGSYDPYGTITNWVWTTNGTPIATGTNQTVSLPVGVHTVQLEVTDNDGSNDTDTVQIQIAAVTTAYYRFEASPGFLKDSSGGGNDLTAGGGGFMQSNTVFPTPVPLTRAANLKAMTAPGNADSAPSLTLGAALPGDFTIEAFVRVDTFDGSAETIFVNTSDIATIPSGWAFSIRVAADIGLSYPRQPVVSVKDTGAAFRTFSPDLAAWSLTESNEYYVAAAFEDAGATETVTFFLQNLTTGGSLASITVGELQPGSFTRTTSADLQVGGSGTVNAFSFDGRIDEVRLSTEALSPAGLLISPPPPRGTIILVK